MLITSDMSNMLSNGPCVFQNWIRHGSGASRTFGGSGFGLWAFRGGSLWYWKGGFCWVERIFSGWATPPKFHIWIPQNHWFLEKKCNLSSLSFLDMHVKFLGCTRFKSELGRVFIASQGEDLRASDSFCRQEAQWLDGLKGVKVSRPL